MNSNQNPIIVAMGMNTLAQKQLKEFEAIIGMGYDVHIFTNDQCGGSAEYASALGKRASHVLLSPTLFKRTTQVASYLKEYRHRIKLVHLYPGGRFAMFYLVLCKRFRLKTVSVEWGSIVDWKILDLLTKMSLALCFRFSDAVWYKEPYMESFIRKLGGRNLYFIHNAFDFNRNSPVSCIEKCYDFVWVNRLASQRKSSWYIKALLHEDLYETRNVLVGIQSEVKDARIREAEREAAALAAPNLQLIPFSDPKEYYKKGRFFVLPATIVFGNNALIEAMAHGLVPIVTESPGVELIVNHGVDGFVTNATFESLQAAMLEAYSLSDAQYQEISRKAYLKIAHDFNIEMWSSRVRNLYSEVAGND